MILILLLAVFLSSCSGEDTPEASIDPLEQVSINQAQADYYSVVAQLEAGYYPDNGNSVQTVPDPVSPLLCYTTDPEGIDAKAHNSKIFFDACSTSYNQTSSYNSVQSANIRELTDAELIEIIDSDFESEPALPPPDTGAAKADDQESSDDTDDSKPDSMMSEVIDVESEPTASITTIDTEVSTSTNEITADSDINDTTETEERTVTENINSTTTTPIETNSSSIQPDQINSGVAQTLNQNSPIVVTLNWTPSSADDQGYYIYFGTVEGEVETLIARVDIVDQGNPNANQSTTLYASEHSELSSVSRLCFEISALSPFGESERSKAQCKNV